jgi:hypothetical protein
MESWGILQQSEKDRYYGDAVDSENRRAEIQSKLDVEISNKRVLLAHYHRLKMILGCVMGIFLLLLYTRFSAATSQILIPMLGPWAYLINILGPIGAFGVGYCIIYLAF